MEIKIFRIIGLHNHKNYELRFDENKLILVSDNGSGKTTIVNIFYYFLSKQWNKLLEFNFKSIYCIINDEEFEFGKNFFNTLIQKDNRINKRFSESTLNKLHNINEFIDTNDLFNLNTFELDLISEKFEIPSRIVREYIFEINEKKESIENHNNVRNLEKKLNKILSETKIIYLPTYRRIEKDLVNIFPHLEQSMREFEFNQNRRLSKEENFVELVEFGMNDVIKKIERRCLQLKNYFYDKLNTNLIGSYLDDILNKSYTNFDLENIYRIDSEALTYILKRLDDSVISVEGKKKLKDFVINLQEAHHLVSIEDKINAHFVWKLFQIYDYQQKEESDINELIDICNEYISNEKSLTYNKDEFKVQINLKNSQLKNSRLFDLFISQDDKEKADKNRLILFKDLSSGEKQIISLFTHLVLSDKNYYIIIDEPELSLSVIWQERLLSDILNLKKCKGLFAVTHSPFIFQNNDLRSITHSLEEFKF